MTIEEIRKNAHSEATHYYINDGYVQYFRKNSKRRKYVEIHNNGNWYDTFTCMTTISKPL